MQELLLADELMLKVNDGTKKGTSRKGRRDIGLSELFLKSVDGTVDDILVEVSSVTFTRLKDIPNDIVVSEGYKNLEELIKTLRRFYPDCGMEDEFTLITW